MSNSKIVQILEDGNRVVNTSNKNINPVDKLDNELIDLRKKFEDQIKAITLRQTSLLNHVLDLENANNLLKSIIDTEKDPKNKSKLYSLISRNIELIAKLHDTYRSFEDVKERYLKDRSEISIKYHKLINIELPAIENKLGSINSDELAMMLKSLNTLFQQTQQSGTSSLSKETLEEITKITDEKYTI